MMRTTRKDAERAFERLVRTLGGRIARNYNDIGAFQFDYNSTYGGCRVELIINSGGGVRCPFGMERLTPAAFVQAVSFTCDVLHEQEAQRRAVA